MDWQAPLGALLGLAALWLGRPAQGEPVRLSPVELCLAALILAYGILGLAGARPQLGLNQALVLAGLFSLALQWRRNGPASDTVAWVWMAMAAVAITIFFAAGWLQAPRWPEDSVGPLLGGPTSRHDEVGAQPESAGCRPLRSGAPCWAHRRSGPGMAGWAPMAGVWICGSGRLGLRVHRIARGVVGSLAASVLWLCVRWRRPGWQRLGLAVGLMVLALAAGTRWAPFSTSRLRVELQADAKEADPNNGRRLDFWKGSFRG